MPVSPVTDLQLVDTYMSGNLLKGILAPVKGITLAGPSEPTEHMVEY